MISPLLTPSDPSTDDKSKSAFPNNDRYLWMSSSEEVHIKRYPTILPKPLKINVCNISTSGHVGLVSKEPEKRAYSNSATQKNMETAHFDYISDAFVSNKNAADQLSDPRLSLRKENTPFLCTEISWHKVSKYENEQLSHIIGLQFTYLCRCHLIIIHNRYLELVAISFLD